MLLSIIISLFPVLLFLLFLILVDSFKLVKFSFVLKIIICGCCIAAVSYGLEKLFKSIIEVNSISIVIAPPVEEILKAIIIIWLFSTKKIGFLTDAAIVGFAVGAGFSLFENSLYLTILTQETFFTWLLRGFGTAIMHGSTTCMVAIISGYLIEKKNKIRLAYFVPGILLAILFHLIFNSFILPPLIMTILIIVVFSTSIFIIYERSEKKLQSWLDESFTNNVLLLQSMNGGQFKETRTGQYLYSLQEILPREILADIFCYLKIYLELAIRAEAMLMMKETGHGIEKDPSLKDKFSELEYIERSIGPSGMAVIKPLLHPSQKDLWQIYFIQTQTQ